MTFIILILSIINMSQLSNKKRQNYWQHIRADPITRVSRCNNASLSQKERNQLCLCFLGMKWRKCRGREGMLFSKREDWKGQRSKHMSHVTHSQGFAWISCHSITISGLIYVSKSKTREGGHSWCRYS